jgi:hypothetical protein
MKHIAVQKNLFRKCHCEPLVGEAIPTKTGETNLLEIASAAKPPLRNDIVKSTWKKLFWMTIAFQIMILSNY